MKKKLTVAAALAALALTGACGGGADRPTTSEIAKSIKAGDSALGTTVPDEAADCVAKVLEGSKLSNDSLVAIVEGDKDYKASKAEGKRLTDLTDDFGKCVTS